MAMTLIETIEVGSGGAASIEFTSIPQDGVNLLILTSLRSEAAASFALVQVNNDTSSYSGIRLQGGGSGSLVAGDTGTEVWITQNASSWTANTYATGSILIPNYAGSDYKSILTESAGENNAVSATARLTIGAYEQTTAVNSVKLIYGSGNFAQYSTASLYIIS